MISEISRLPFLSKGHPVLILQFVAFTSVNISLNLEKRKESAENARLEEENERLARENGSMLEWLVDM